MIEFPFKYFIYNYQRSIKGSKIAAIGFIAIISTSLLIASLSEEITTITSQLGREDKSLIIKGSENELTLAKIDQIEQLLLKKNLLLYYNFEYVIPGKFTSGKFEDVDLSLRLTNLTKLHNNELLKINLAKQVIATSDLAENYNLVVSDLVILKFLQLEMVTPLTEIVSIRKNFVQSGIYLNYSNYEDLILNSNQFFIYIQITSETNTRDAINLIHQNFGISAEIYRGESRFLISSITVIEDTLILLQFLISILVVLSLNNLMNIIIQESKYDIRVYKSIGFSKRSLIVLFVSVGALIGILGGILTLLLSSILVMTVLAVLAASTGFSYIFINLGSKFAFQIFLNIVMVSLIASIYPSYKGVKD